MHIQQISVFVENKPGRMAEITETISAAAVDIRAISIADTSDFGILRVIVNQPEKAAEVLRGATDLPIYAQGDDQLPTLVRAFAEDEAACLVGTLSLWQGVDVPGRTCRLVVIDKIPFPRPDDPVSRARSMDVERRGGNGFVSVSLTHAALMMAQGVGRLLRSTDDRGVVAILDPRVVTKRYGGFIMRSLPAMWPTTDPQVVRGALRRLAQGAEH